jgi:pilus assembly protein CpaE
LNFNALNEAYLRVYKQAYQAIVDKEPAKIFSFFSCKGGSGCTTIATNFAVSLGRVSKKKILVLDLDLEFGDVTGFFGIKTEKFLVTQGSEPASLDAKRLSRAIVTHPKTGIDVLSFCDGFPKNPGELASEIKPMLATLQREYDFIIVDTSSKLNDLIVATLDSSHLIFLISKCSLPALWNAQRVLHGFERLGYSSSRIRVLINRYLKDEGVSLKEVEKALGFDVFWSLPNDYKSIIRSIQCGEPLTWQSNTVPLARSFYELSAVVLGIKIESPKSAGGLLTRAKQPATKSLPLTTLNLLKS